MPAAGDARGRANLDCRPDDAGYGSGVGEGEEGDGGSLLRASFALDLNLPVVSLFAPDPDKKNLQIKLLNYWIQGGSTRRCAVFVGGAVARLGDSIAILAEDD